MKSIYDILDEVAVAPVKVDPKILAAQKTTATSLALKSAEQARLAQIKADEEQTKLDAIKQSQEALKQNLEKKEALKQKQLQQVKQPNSGVGTEVSVKTPITPQVQQAKNIVKKNLGNAPVGQKTNLLNRNKKY